MSNSLVERVTGKGEELRHLFTCFRSYLRTSSDPARRQIVCSLWASDKPASSGIFLLFQLSNVTSSHNRVCD